MKPGFLFKLLTFLLLLAACGFYGCVQPYSSNAFYKASNRANNPPSDAAPSAQSLLPGDITSMLNTPDLSEQKLGSLLKKMDHHWLIKGFDRKTGEVFYFNFYSAGNREALIWHRGENSANYITMNTKHYQSIIDNLKTSGYKRVSSSPAAGDSYSNGNTDIAISPVQVFDGNGFRFIFKPAIK